MSAGTDRADVVNATLEGVGHGLAQGIAALESTGVTAQSISLIGGGSRSPYWAQMIADLSGKTLLRRAERRGRAVSGRSATGLDGCRQGLGHRHLPGARPAGGP